MFAFFVGLAMSPATAEATPSAELQEAVDGWASNIGAPGMTARIVDADGVVAEASTGVDGNSNPVNSSTPFVWGSVSKQFTAATVLGLERDGVVDEGASVVDVVPQSRQMLADPAVTVGDLIHHTSGLPHDLTVTDDWSRRDSAVDAVADMRRPGDAAERGTFRYSSLNYLLLQAVVEKTTGGSFADALGAEVLNPSGATGTIVDPDEFVDVVPPGHVPFFGEARSIDVGVDSAGLGYGYLAGSIEDLGRYASWRLGEVATEDDAEVTTGSAATYGYGLYHETIAGLDVWWHSGAVPGYYTYVALVPGTNTAIVLATNRYGELEAERVAAVGRNLATLAIDGSTSALPGSMATLVLGVLLGVVAVLIAVIVWTIVRMCTGRVKTRSRRATVVRVVCAVVIGATVLASVYLAVTAFVGASPSVMALWAPDVTLLFWILLGAVLLASAAVVAESIVACRGFRRDRKNVSNRVVSPA